MLLEKVHEAPYVLHAIPGSANQEVRISLVEHEGRICADLRLHLRIGPGQAVATPQGITVPLAQLPDLEVAVAKLRQRVEQLQVFPGS